MYKEPRVHKERETMSYILSVYSVKAFKEILLPAIDNADYSITISKDIFSLTEDVIIPLEVVMGQWIFRSAALSIVSVVSGDAYTEKPLTDGDLFSLNLPNKQIINIIVKEIKDSFIVYKKYDIGKLDCIRIGKNEGCDIQYSILNLISREHGIIRKKGGQYIVEDTSANGIFINSMRIAGSWQLSFGDCIDIFGLRMVFLGDVLAISEGLGGVVVRQGKLSLYKPVSRAFSDRLVERQKVGATIFHRSPRKIYKLENDTVEIEGPPAAKEKDRQPLAMILGPSLTMALPMLLGCSLTIYSAQASGGSNSAFMYTGLVTAVSSALIGTAWSLVNIRYNKKKNREEEIHRFEAYSEYLIKCTEQIKAKYEKNAVAMKEMYPSAEECSRYSEDSVELWNRNISHKDMLFVRLGIGDVPFQVTVNIPADKFTMINDPLAEKPRMIRESYKILHNVPVGVDLLKQKLIGVFGGEKRRGTMIALYNIVAQIAANNCYTDVKMVFVYDEKKYDGSIAWNFAKWLPHVWSDDKKIRYVAKDKSEASDVLYELTKVLRIRQEESVGSYSSREIIPLPYYILFIADQDLLEGELISKYIFEPKQEYGMTTILLEETYEELPNACDYLIQNDSGFQGAYSVDDNSSEKQEIKFDVIAGSALEEMGRRLSNVEVNETEAGGEIPNALTFLEMYRVNRLDELRVLDRWRKNRTYDSMKALVGQKSGGMDCYLDVHEKYHGPHGLVAGTTGSGKSETLQTYILSLAVNFSPDDVGFFIIDYKGGGMANLFSGLPHMIGQISNLSGNQVHRAMVSIKSENMRRQRVFNEHGVNNINLYTKLYKNNEAAIPIPHMFIIIDEFAELKREEPDFMRELISVAQVGRSLGVHLILATQKPSGTVDENIWSNSKFKLCLRVQDRQDSNDMLHKPDAAYITQAGRCYLQVGNDELYELFQSGFSGAVYDASEDSVKTDIARMLSDTGRAALIGSRTKIKQKNARKKKWIGLLTEKLQKVAEDLDITLGKGTLPRTDRDRMIQQVFRMLDADKVEYPATEYNVHRMEELLQVYETICSARKETDDRELAVRMIDLAGKTGKKLPEQKEKTQLDAVVEYLAQTAEENGYQHNLQLWLPVLPTELYLDDLDGYTQTAYKGHIWPRNEKTWSLNVYVGLCDDPVNQAQMPLIMDLALNGHYAICGTVVSGKSTFLQTFVFSVICKYTPQEVSIYGIDFGSKMLAAFEESPHVGGIVYEGEEDRIAKFFTMLSGMLEERKKLFRGGNYSQYVRANGVVLPAIILVLDNFANFRGQTDCRYDDLFIQMTKEGVGYGIYIVLTAAGFGTLEIPSRIGDNFRAVISLEMGDKFQYMDVMRTTSIDVLPEENVKGRGLVKVGDSLLEYQTALALRAEDDFKRSEAIARLAENMKNSWRGKLARKIPEIPKNFVWTEFAETEEVQDVMQDDRHLPVGYDTKSVSVYGVDLAQTYCYLLSGKSRTGKTNMLKVLIRSALLKGGKINVIDYSGELCALCGSLDVNYITDDEALYTYLKDNLIPIFKDRNGKKRAWIAEGLSDEEIYIKMIEEVERIYFFIADIPEFIKHIYAPAEGIGQMNAVIENFLEKGSLHNIFWFGCMKLEDSNTVSGIKAYDLFVRYKRGVHFGGNVSAQRIFNFDYIQYAEQSKTEKAGIAMLPATEEETVRKVAIPLCKGRA